MINFIICTVFPLGTSKFDDILDLIQFFQIGPESVLIEVNGDNNVIYNNFEYDDQLPKNSSFLSRSH